MVTHRRVRRVRTTRALRKRAPFPTKGDLVSQIDSNGLSLHYEDTAGDGRPVVLIHGWPR